MVRIHFNNTFMQAPGSAASREYLVTAASGAYASADISGCSTRKYHGLLVAPQPQLDDDNHVLLAALDETLLRDGSTYQLAVRQYPGVLGPAGYRFIEDFTPVPVPRWTYRAGSMTLVKELVMADDEDRVLLRYTMEGAPAATLQLRPFIAFRNMHSVARSNAYADLRAMPAAGGISMKLYAPYTELFMQLSVAAPFIDKGYWYYNVEYELERQRGYEYREDLYSPGYFEATLLPGQPLVLTAGLYEQDIADILPRYNRIAALKKAPQTMEDLLRSAARQFIVNTRYGTAVRAGYHWFGVWSRDTCIALPGLTLLAGNIPAFTQALSALCNELQEGLLPNAGLGKHAACNSVDAPLWLIRAVQLFAYDYGNLAKAWARYGETLGSILYYYRTGTRYHIHMEENGLITAGAPGVALTWMDAVTPQGPVTPRTGKAVEVNALWYNAVCFCLEAARRAGDKDFVQEWEAYPRHIAQAFRDCFWDAERQYLADCVDGTVKDWSVRPNQLMAVSLPFSPLDPVMQQAVVRKVKAELLTPYGLRTLSPSDSRYCGRYEGNQPARDSAYHQGTVWPWLLAHFAEAALRAEGAEALPLLEALYEGMSAALEARCLYSVPEIFDGDEPHRAGGAIAQAWSVGELIRMKYVINRYKQKHRAPSPHKQLSSRL